MERAQLRAPTLLNGVKFDGLERQIVQVSADLTQQIVESRTDLEALRAEMRLGFGALKEAIEGLDEHGRRLTQLESRS